MWTSEPSRLLQFFWALAIPIKVILAAPRLVTGISDAASAENLGETTETLDSLLRQPLWFDYPDSDKKKIFAIYKLIGEEHVFVRPSPFPQILRNILVGSVILIVLFFLYQILSKVIANRPHI